MKLLNRTIRTYLFYSITILLVAIPLFYLVVKKVLLRSVDHSLRAQMREIRSNLPSIHSVDEFQVWAKMDKDIRLTPGERSGGDSVYTIYYPDPRHHDEDPYREIAGSITVNNQRYILVISNSLVENEDLLGSILLVQAFLMVLLLAGMVLINRSSSKKIWRPFYTALDNMKKYELADHRLMNFDETNIDEFKQLNGALKQLTERNYEVYLQQKEFTENAAHEMQTPLAIFQGKIDLLMQTEPLSEEQALLIASLEEVNLRLAKLNKSLLLLSRIENNQFSQIEKINLNELTKNMLDEFKVNADARHISITQQYDNDLVFDANRIQVEMLVSNLILNAIRHNMEGGEIQVAIKNRVFSISNTGSDSSLPADKIFERFYKSGQHSASLGLGLAIVKEICDQANYSISYQFNNGWHQFHFSPDPAN